MLGEFQIADRLGCSEGTVRSRLREYGISVRRRVDYRKCCEKKDFDGSIVDMSYILGFRLGDLNVYQPHSTNNYIVVRGNSTRQEQLDLIVGLFSKFGKVTISPGEYSTNVNCYLNMSFSFLLPKYRTVPSWVNYCTESILAFIAGYTDAEGSMTLNQGRARFKIDCYDKEILEWIHQSLIKNNIDSILKKIANKGQLAWGGFGGTYNKDLWRLNINKANSILTFTDLVGPYLRHSTRVGQLKLMEFNVVQRRAFGTVT